ncbi:hypothetical protein MPH_06677 [Macrophomina phaseolina MS6]|uniref:Mg2+ transporter protein CorA-like/Zinc transport protein ZntB n=1 Tax=Macrophomina phaseolina (strain MS6) TaxID=1126212 RepID=K2R1M1_MACPH|nr:hypothetical protein MPH_06677 [Macrophomina phaseolina MS6]
MRQTFDSCGKENNVRHMVLEDILVLIRGYCRYIANITPDCVFSLVETSSTLSLDVLRSFLSQHILFRPSFAIHFGPGGLIFNLEFHITFFALREGSANSDPRSVRGRRLRSTRLLPLSDGRELYFHECQISLLVTGVDEWVWTGYCFVDSYFGKEEDYEDYFKTTPNDPYGRDPATGGTRWLRYPLWNPREYFLWVLAARVTQATQEWTLLINTFEERMDNYQEERESTNSFIDEPQFPHTEKLTMTVQAIRRLRDTLENLIAAWDAFEGGDVVHLETKGSDEYLRKWGEHLAEARKGISQLRFFRKLLAQKLDLFQSKLDGLVNASALRESATTTRQGENIGILTKMTVLYLPLSLATGVFSMSVIPGEAGHVVALCVSYVLLLTVFLIATVVEARHPRVLNFVFGEGNQE